MMEDKLIEQIVAERTQELVRINNELILEIGQIRRLNKETVDLSLFPELNPAPVIKLNKKGEIVLCNTAALKLFKKKSLIGKLWSAIAPSSSEAKCFIQNQSTSKICQHECKIHDKHFLFTYQKMAGTEFTFIFGADITQRRRAEKLLQKAHDNLEDVVNERTLALQKAQKNLRQALVKLEQLKNRLQEENIYLQEEIKLNHNFEEIIGHSNAIKTVLNKVELVASTDATVLITGETGTGKELFARAIHNLSPRNNRLLVKVNCASLQPMLIESELFGHEKGSFTGAYSQKRGRFELADGSAIFLDEIGDLTFELQAKLLRVIQEKEFERIGGTKPIKVDVRVIAATHKDLKKEVQLGNFREDLYYRLNVFPIHLPPLRERQEDIAILIQHFVNKYSSKFEKNIQIIPQRILSALQAAAWPGNVRELENIIERAAIYTNGDTLELDVSLFENLTLVPEAKSSDPRPAITLDDLQRDHIRQTLLSTNWRIEGEQGAALRLGINASTLRSRIKKLGISRP